MIRRSEYEKSHPGIHEGMTAYTRDGEKLGRVVDLADDNLVVEKGFFFPKDFTFHYDDIADVRADSLIIDKERPDLEQWRNAGYEGSGELEKSEEPEKIREGEPMRDVEKETIKGQTGSETRGEISGETRGETRSETGSEFGEKPSSEKMNVPLYEEELRVEKIAHEAGEVRVKKVVHSEIKNIEVPVTKEEVVIERKTPTGEALPTGEKIFKEEEMRIPVMEEEIRISKHPVEKERVEVRKETTTEKKKVSGEVRSEDIEIEDKGDLRHEKK
jgi:uncharacterized protein (TIGR02271 family)